MPLDSQPWITKTEYPYIHAPDPLRDFPPLPRHAHIRRQLRGVRTDEAGQTSEAERRARAADAAAAARAPRPGESASWITRTAICVEARNGILYLFMPPALRLPLPLPLLPLRPLLPNR